MQFMHCTTCKGLVQVNATGTCLGCQKGFAGPQEDAWTKKDFKPDDKGLLETLCEQHPSPEEEKKESYEVKRKPGRPKRK